MDQLLEDYKSYYKARLDRYENDPLFVHSYASEKALSEAMASCQELIEFKDKLGDLNIKNAIALVKDHEKARLQHFIKLKEPIRALAPQWILEKIDSAKNENDVITISMEMEQKVNIAIIMDGFIDSVWLDFIPYLEHLEVMEKADIPSKYDADRQREVGEIKQKIRDKIIDLNREGQNWEANWSLNFDLTWEFRHRNKIPLNDAVLEKRLNELKTFA